MHRPANKIPTYSELDTVHPGRHLNGLASFNDGVNYRFVWNKSQAGETTVTLFDPAHPGVKKLYAPQRAEIVREDCNTRPALHEDAKKNQQAREASFDLKERLNREEAAARSLRDELARILTGDRTLLGAADLFIADTLIALTAHDTYQPTPEGQRALKHMKALRAVLDTGDAATKRLDAEFKARAS